ncbi:MAG: DUF2256 domain-containing protein [Planctomycetota bacterium]
MKSKSHLPERTCKACQKSFSWRKKWERDWDRVLYCSERCRRNSKAAEKKA